MGVLFLKDRHGLDDSCGGVDVVFHHSDSVGNPHLSCRVDSAVAVGCPSVAPGLAVVMLMGDLWYFGERPVISVIGQM